jgi:DNA-binding FadR family transcriptional regulator
MNKLSRTTPSALEVSLGAARGGLHQRAVDMLGYQIVSGQFRPGDIIAESDLGKYLNTSRGVLREAVKVLAAKGLVESRRKIGTSISPRSQWNLLDPDIIRWWSATDQVESFTRTVFEVRKIIEPAAAAMVAERGSDSDVARIADAFRAMVSYTGRDSERSVQLDCEFHVAILESTGNVLLRSFGLLIKTALSASFRLRSALLYPEEDTWPMHEAVMKAIATRDAKRAYDAANTLLDNSKAWLIDVAEGTGKASHAKTSGLGRVHKNDKQARQNKPAVRRC